MTNEELRIYRAKLFRDASSMKENLIDPSYVVFRHMEDFGRRL